MARRYIQFIGLLLWTGFSFNLNSADSPDPFAFKDGDRVVFLGDTLVERAQSYGYIETRLTGRFPDLDITFRNLGWSADTPQGKSRASFDWNKPPSAWFQELTNQVATLEPTVVFIGYGMADSFRGEAHLEAFREELTRLIAAIQQVTPDWKVRFVLLTPLRHENLGDPLPDPAPHNRQLELYSQAIKEIAREGGHRLISLFDQLSSGEGTPSEHPLTDNGIHLTEYGYWRAAEVIEKELGWLHSAWRVGITPEGKVREESYGVDVSELEREQDHVRFTGTLEQHPPYFVDPEKRRISMTPPCMVQIQGLSEGEYTLLIDDRQVATASAREWNRGQVIRRGAPFSRAEELRQTIIRKNELFFHRWRPQNQTYLFGFRKHEQGQNAIEIPQFDPLVVKQEEKIARLRQPAAHAFELIRSSEGDQQDYPQAREPGVTTPPPADAAKILPDPENKQPVPEFEVAPGFEVNLYAENPLIAKPIQINFDPQGRLWVASSAVYPQIKPGQKADDKILVLEDTDQDGRADQSTVFADGLLIPTGVEPGDGGAYVGQSTELLHFEDTDGDLQADKKRVVLSGFGTEDTHHILHTLRWGHDGQLYFNQSIYIHSHIETPHGVVRLNSGGIYHLRPPTMELEVFLRGWVNPWGHDFDGFGQSFVTDGAGFQGINYGVPGAMYFTYAGARRTLQSISPGHYPKFCGLELVDSPNFPDDWQGDAITCDFRAHRVVRFEIEENGSAYRARELPDLLRSTNVTFRPIDVKFGPDGALYIADWSNPIIQHGEVDFRDPRRDHVHGRIWRVTAKSPSEELSRLDLARVRTGMLLRQLQSESGYRREQARRVLTERGPKVFPALENWVENLPDPADRLQALWMYQSLDRVEPGLLRELLNAQDGRIRAAAVRVLGYWHDRLHNPLELLADRIQDNHPRVRLETLRTLARIPTSRSAALALSALEHPMDPFLDYALWLTINDLAEPWLESVQSGQWEIEGHEKQLEFALQSIEPDLAKRVLSRLLEAHPIDRQGSGPWIEIIGQAGTPSELRHLLDLVLEEQLEPSAAVRALNAISEANRLRQIKPEGNLPAVETLFNHADLHLRRAAIQLAGQWQLRSSIPKFVQLARDSALDKSIRLAALNSLRQCAGQEDAGLFSRLAPLTQPDQSGDVRRQTVLLLASVDMEKALPALVEVLLDTPNESEALEFWRALLNLPPYKGQSIGQHLAAEGLPATGIPEVIAKTGLRAAREGGRQEPDLVLALTRGANLEGAQTELTDQEMESLVETVQKEGDPERGEQVYRRPELGCVSCHAIGGVGGQVGPDLTSIGASAPLDYLIEAILSPNKNIKEGYHSVTVETKSDFVYSGVPVRETTQELVLRNAANQEMSVPKNQIVERRLSGSLMPSGLVDYIDRRDRIDLFRFMSELGKSGRYDAARGNVARLWHLRPASHTEEQFGAQQVTAKQLESEAWRTAHSWVDGRLLQKHFNKALHSDNPNRATGFVGLYAATRLETSRSGSVELRLTGIQDVPLWIDGEPVVGSPPFKPHLEAGTHTVLLRLDPNQLPEFIRLESPDATFLLD